MRRGGRNARARIERALIVDDDVQVCLQWGRLFAQHGVEPTLAHSIQSAKQRLDEWSRRPFDYVLLDLRLDDGDGSQLIEPIRELDARAVIVVLSGNVTAERSVELAGRVAATLQKPVSLEAVPVLIEKLRLLRACADALGSFMTSYALTRSECDVLRSRFAALSDKEIAERRGCGLSAVRKTWTRIYSRLGASSFPEIVALLEAHTDSLRAKLARSRVP